MSSEAERDSLPTDNTGQMEGPPPPKRPGFFSSRRRAAFGDHERKCPREKAEGDTADGPPGDASAIPPEANPGRWWRHRHHEHRRWRHDLEKFGPGYNPADGQTMLDPTGHHGNPPEGPWRHQWCRGMWTRWGDMLQTEERALFKEFDF